MDFLETARSLQTLVAEHADDAERQRHLSPEVAEAFARTGLMRMAAPRSVPGGGDADPISQLECIEAIARADGSAGWNLMIGIENFGLLAPGMQACIDLIEDTAVILASSTANVGTAVRGDDGFRVSGRWQFVSGCQQSSVFGATVRPTLADGSRDESFPERAYALLTRDQYSIDPTWNVAGMAGTGSHDVVVDDQFVPLSHMTVPLGAASHESPLARIPIGIRLAYNKVGVSLGITRAIIDDFRDLALGKIPRFTSRTLAERPRAQSALAYAEVQLRSVRALVMEQMDAMWRVISAGDRVATDDRALFQATCSYAVETCVAAADRIAAAAGTSANDAGAPLARRLKDVRVVMQHLTVAPQHIDDAGRVMLGLEPADLMLRMPG